MKHRIILLFLPFLAITAIYAHPFAGGNGAKANPYQISTPVQLDSVRHYLDKSFILLNDIDLNVAPYNTGEGWNPIGDLDNPFCGILNGAGHVISDLYILKLTGDYIGYALFSNSDNSNFFNLGLENCNVNAFFQPSTLLSNSENDTIISCYSTGNVITSGTSCGGLVCNLNVYCLMQNCYSTCNISSYGGGGGLGFFCADGTVNNCFATGNINCTPNPYTGGLFGIINSAIINNCYSTGNINGGSSVGGFVGYQIWSSRITNCYSTGKVNGKIDVGGFLGILLESSVVNNCFYNKETSGFSESGKGNPQTTAEMKHQSTFTSWDFSGIWLIREDSTYPGLKSLNNAPFALFDTLGRSETINKSKLLKNDFDIESKQTMLVLKIVEMYGADKTDSSNWNNLSTGFVFSRADSMLYRIGEVLSTDDTLWGNAAKVIIRNNAPVITSEAIKQANENILYSYTVIASDIDGDSLEYTLSNAPDGMSIKGNVISWTPAKGTTTSGEVTLKVNDGKLSATQIFTIIVSKVSSITFADNDSFLVFPNPANEELTVKFDGKQDKIIKILIVASDGRVVYSLSRGNINIDNSNNLHINISGLPAGLYALQISYGTYTKTQKLLKK